MPAWTVHGEPLPSPLFTGWQTLDDGDGHLLIMTIFRAAFMQYTIRASSGWGADGAILLCSTCRNYQAAPTGRPYQ